MYALVESLLPKILHDWLWLYMYFLKFDMLGGVHLIVLCALAAVSESRAVHAGTRAVYFVCITRAACRL